jgi:fructuronate reductase
MVDQLLADPAIRVITLTITEKGYCLGADGWSLDRELPQLQRDLEAPDRAVTAIGVLARGLALRHRQNRAALTLISCDNLGENSARLRAVLLEYLQATYPHVIPWLQADVAFPCSMVDRIVPAMTDEGVSSQSLLLGAHDEGAVATEPFSQWIIEHHCATALPDWAAAGALFVDNIRAYEEMKLRLLNASHSAIALAGQLSGCETVADVLSDKVLGGFVAALMSEELAPAVLPPANFDLARYQHDLLERFANPHLKHRCAQIATDSSEKIRQRWLTTLRAQAEDSRLLRALACWCYLVLRSELPVSDPRSAQLMIQRNSKASIADRLCAVLHCAGIDYADGWLGEARFQRLLAFMALPDAGALMGELR